MEHQAGRFLHPRGFIFARTPAFLGGGRRLGFFFHRLFPHGDGRGITTDMSNQLRPQVLAHQRLMDPLGQRSGGEGRKRARKGGLRGNLPSAVPPAQPPQRRTLLYVVQQRPARGKVPHRLGDEGLGQREAILRFTPQPLPLIRCHETFHLDQRHDPDELLLLRRERPHFRFPRWKQLPLYATPNPLQRVHRPS